MRDFKEFVPKPAKKNNCRVRTGRNPAEHEALVKHCTPIRTPGAGAGDYRELSEVVAAWADLPDVLKGAILGIVRSAQPGARQ